MKYEAVYSNGEVVNISIFRSSRSILRSKPRFPLISPTLSIPLFSRAIRCFNWTKSCFPWRCMWKLGFPQYFQFRSRDTIWLSNYANKTMGIFRILNLYMPSIAKSFVYVFIYLNRRSHAVHKIKYASSFLGNRGFPFVILTIIPASRD